MGSGLKFSEKVKPFPVCPPELIVDPAEYGEFILPEIKVLTPEELKKELAKHYEECWEKVDADDDGNISKDDAKKVAAEIKAKMLG